jgi:6-phospho-3-hexuloisomerase
MPFSQENDNARLKQAGQDLLDRIGSVMAAVDWSEFLALARLLVRSERIYVTGAGRSGLVARMFGMRLMHAGLTAYIPGETITPAAGPGDVMIAISCTGDTGYTEYLARRAHELGATVAVITAATDSPLAAPADEVVLVPARAEDIVVRAAVFEHATSLCLDAIFNVLSERLKVDAAAFSRRHANLE